jgi:L-threonylcarbamoyladenylate synthase
LILRGGVIIYPTETFYGLGADATNNQAILRIFDIKGRNFGNPISVIIGSKHDLQIIIRESTPVAEKLMNAFWPGPLTIVFKAKESISPLLTAQTGKIGVRLSANEIARQIAQKSGRPLTATSANLSGMPECANAEEAIKQIGNKIDTVIDAGATAGGVASTVIDVTCTPPRILREGTISQKSIEKTL